MEKILNNYLITTSGQQSKLDSFLKQNPAAKIIKISVFREDPRQTWNRLHNNPDWIQLGKSNGCSASKGNFHSTWAHIES